MKLHELSTTAGRVIRDRRNDRHRVVFAYQAPRFDLAVNLLDDPSGQGSPAARSLGRLLTRQPGNPVGGTVARPLADAAHTLLVLRAR